MNWVKSALKIKLNLANPYLIRPQFKALQQLTDKPLSSIAASFSQRHQINHDTHIFRFNLNPPNDQKCLGLSIGEHIQLSFKGNKRKYVPISKIDDVGIVDLVIRDLSKANTNSFTSHLMALKEGQEVSIRGPFHQFKYLGYGKFQSEQKIVKKFKRIGIIACQTGITTVFSLMDSIAANMDQQTGISLLYIASNKDNFIFLQELNSFVEQRVLNLNLMLSNYQEGWIGPYGSVDRTKVSDYLPRPADDTILIFSGEEIMVNQWSQLTTSMGYQHIIQPKFK